MENFIQIQGVKYNADPKTKEEWSNCINAAVAVLGVMCFLGTSEVKDEKERLEKMLKLAGEMGGAVGRHAIMILANSSKQKPKGGQDA